jgi:hypothetical protein
MFFGWTDKNEIADAFTGISQYSGETEKKQAEPEKLKILKDLEGLIFANLDSWSYEESARIIFERDGKLWEVKTSHCSCNGFEDAWAPEETSWEQLKMIKPEEFSEEKEGQKFIVELLAKH